MVGIYFSGTGNTKHCVDIFMERYGGRGGAVSVERPEAADAVKKNDDIVFAYPIYFSSLPKIVRDFITEHGSDFRGKNVFIIATMGLFSGDGAGCSARLFKKYGANVTGGLHVRMPDCIGDVKALKKTLEQNRRIVSEAERKTSGAAESLRNGDPPREGLGLFSRIAGLFGQRLWFSGKTRVYSDKLRIDGAKCAGCGTCVVNCPMKNLSLKDGKATANGKCTMCYRCVNNCPRAAVTLLGKDVYEQCRCENYVSRTAET